MRSGAISFISVCGTFSLVTGDLSSLGNCVIQAAVITPIRCCPKCVSINLLAGREEVDGHIGHTESGFDS